MAEEKDFLGWVQYAIEIEVKGLNYYTECLKKTRNARAMELFEYLVNVETGHRRVLTELLKAATQGDAKLLKQSVDEFLKIKIPIPLFDTESLEKMKKRDTTLMEMFNTAIGMEQTGIDLYTDLAKKNEGNATLKKLFTRLASDEKEHKKELKDLGYFVFGTPPADELM
jgi:rubrerythrin